MERERASHAHRCPPDGSRPAASNVERGDSRFRRNRYYMGRRSPTPDPTEGVISHGDGARHRQAQLQRGPARRIRRRTRVAGIEKIADLTVAADTGLSRLSLVGLTRDELKAQARPHRRARARAQDARRAALALDLSPRRPRFDDDDQCRQGPARGARRGLHARPARGRLRAGLEGRHPQMADPHAAGAARRQGRRDRVRLHPRDRPRHALRLEPGRLHAHLLLLPHRHAARSCAT